MTPNPEKRNAKILGNTIKTLASGHSGPVLPFLVKRDFLRKIELFKDLTIVNTTQKSIKNEWGVPQENSERMGRQTTVTSYNPVYGVQNQQNLILSAK